jgi:hypothetical protein
MEISNIIIGLILLGFGRKLFWLVIGLVGFLLGLEITRLFFGGQPQWLQLAIAIGLGCLGALLAMLAQRVAFAVGGFFAGVFLAFKLSQIFAGPDNSTILLGLIIAAGICGAVVATLFIDQAITIFACLVGAGAIVGELPLGPGPGFGVFIILSTAGFLVQGKLLPAGKEGHPAPMKPPAAGARHRINRDTSE